MSEANFTTTVARDFWHLMAGDRIGGGIAREVYSCRIDRSIVIKIETGGQSFQNISEWQMWQDRQHCPSVAKWLAPCIDISACGIILLQRRTVPIRTSELPEKVPDFATDLKLENWGMLDGKPVMHDYGFTRTITDTKLRKAKWR